MNIEEAKRVRPCCKCVHRQRCQVVNWIYSPCYETDKDGLDHHGAFELDTNNNCEED